MIDEHIQTDTLYDLQNVENWANFCHYYKTCITLN